MKTKAAILSVFLLVIGASVQAGVDSFTTQKIQKEVRSYFELNDLVERNIKYATARVQFRVNAQNQIEILNISSENKEAIEMILEKLDAKKLKSVEVPGEVFALPINFKLL